MKKTGYYNYIEEKLSILSHRIETRGRINLLDLNIYSESFFANLVNMVFSYQFVNLNQFKQNVEGIDLIDYHNKIIAQISSTNTKVKVESSLSKGIIEKHKDFNFKFILISKNAINLRNNSFVNPYDIKFNPQEDIIDILSILKQILELPTKKQKEIYNFMKEELGNEVDIVKTDSNLATIINILAKESLMDISTSHQIDAFDIEKKIEFNHLLHLQEIFDDYKIYYHKLNEKYGELDKIAPNKSFSILQSIRHNYIKISTEKDSSIDIFYEIINKVIETIKNSPNYEEIAFEYLEMCTYIIVVDAFIKCKIFKNPKTN